MSPEQQAAYINAQVACAMIEVEGMKVENAKRGKEAPLYEEADFAAVIEKYGIYHNAVLGWFQSWA